jgi:hypothetical protein
MAPTIAPSPTWELFQLRRPSLPVDHHTRASMRAPLVAKGDDVRVPLDRRQSDLLNIVGAQHLARSTLLWT